MDSNSLSVLQNGYNFAKQWYDQKTAEMAAAKAAYDEAVKYGAPANQTADLKATLDDVTASVADAFDAMNSAKDSYQSAKADYDASKASIPTAPLSGTTTANDGSTVRTPVPGRSYNQEDAIEELGMTADQAAQFVSTGVDPRTTQQASQSVTTTFPDGSQVTSLVDNSASLDSFLDGGFGTNSSLTTTLPDGSITTSLATDANIGDLSDLAAALPDDGLVPSSDGVDDGSQAPIVVTGQRIKDRPDHRVRLSAFRNQEEQVYGTNDKTQNILQPLWDTQGLMFPYTPTVAVSQDTTWNAADLEGVNYDILSFKTSASASLSVTGKFTVQNQREGRYLLACIHFLRTVSKAYFGSQDVERFVAPTAQTNDATAQADPSKPVSEVNTGGRAGLPPPILLFSGYGNMMFNDIRVVVKSHSWSYDEASDLIRIDLPAFSGTVWLPPLMTIQMTLGIQQNTDNVRNNFSLDDFRTGKLLKTRGWF